MGEVDIFWCFSLLVIGGMRVGFGESRVRLNGFLVEGEEY